MDTLKKNLDRVFGYTLRREAADQERNEWAKKGEKIAADDARSTKEVEDGKHTSGGVMIAVKEEVAPEVDTVGCKVEGLEDNTGRNLQRWTNRKGGLQIIALKASGFAHKGHVLPVADGVRCQHGAGKPLCKASG